MINLGRRCRHFRIDKGITMKEFAQKMNVHPSYISGIELGRRKPGRDYIKKILKAFPECKEFEKELNDYFEEAIIYYKIRDAANKIHYDKQQFFYAEINELLSRYIPKDVEK